MTQQEYQQMLVERYTNLLNAWNAAMNAGDYDKGSQLMAILNTYRDALGL